MTLAVAIIPSNQDSNLGVITGYSEAGGMRDVLAPKVLDLFNHHNITAKVFAARNESLDKTRYEGLYGVCRNAKSWLASINADLKIALHLHTNATPQHYSHTAYLYGSDEGKEWGQLVASRVQTILGTEKIVPLNYDDYIFYTELRPYTSMLLEVCAHDNLRDLEALYAYVDAVAGAIVSGTLEFACGANFGNTVPCARCADLRRQLATANDTIAARNGSIAELRSQLDTATAKMAAAREALSV